MIRALGSVRLLPILTNSGKGILKNLMETLYIQAKPNQRYLSEVLKDYGNALPKNCLFDKVTTGCGGTYVALTSPEPYVIAVPTKALVEDKIKSQGYANVKLIAILNPEGVLLQPLTATAKIAPELSVRNKSRLNAGKKPSTKDMVEIFKTDPEFILEVDPDLHSWLSVLGVEKKIANSQYMNKQMLKHWFKVGNVYKPDEIKVKVQSRTGIAPKSTQEALKLVRKYYEVKATVRKGFKVYQIVQIF